MVSSGKVLYARHMFQKYLQPEVRCVLIDTVIPLEVYQPAHNVVSMLILGCDVDQTIFNVETTLFNFEHQEN